LTPIRSSASLHSLARQLSGRRVAVLGDVMLDHFLIGRVDRISPEAPVPVVRFDREEYRLGGAANVAHNIAAMGGHTALVGLVGDDEAAGQLRAALRACGVADDGLVEDNRPTTRKVRIVTARNQQVARIDYERDGEATGPVLDKLRERGVAAVRGSDVAVLSDYRKGVVCEPLIETVIGSATEHRVPLLIDPKVPRAERYRGATLVTPNHHEAELMTAMTIRTIDDARRAARSIHERSGASVLITWGEHGMWLLDAGGSSFHEESLAASAREVSDVTGAGDTVIALLALSLAAGASLADAAKIANAAAGLAVARFGPAAIGPEELLTALGDES
jgi:D-beta-D-heptose 7-phosphate kinase/D-beta-D-heptose 1-phosphate adenosyltransferase